ncbi:MAG: helix-turn-helix domain-containing protein, partial [Candidatus Dormiibacterota bacterium]
MAERFGVTDQTVGKWRFRFVRRRLDGLIDDPRPGAPRRVTDDQIQRLVDKT